MTQDLKRLQSEWDQLKAEVENIQAEYKNLCRQRSAFQVQLMFPQGNSPEDLEAFHQQATEEVAKWSVNLKALNQSLRVTRVRLKKKRTQMIVKQTQIYRMQARQLWPSLCQQAEEINQVVDYLQQKLETFKQTSHNFQHQPYPWLPKYPKLVEANEVHLPIFERQDNHWTVEHKTINWDSESPS
jgi:chromosome segregation ATPase